MSNREELEAAIKTCKLQIVDVEPNSEDAKNLIHKLVQLRLKLADSMVQWRLHLHQQSFCVLNYNVYCRHCSKLSVDVLVLLLLASI